MSVPFETTASKASWTTADPFIFAPPAQVSEVIQMDPNGDLVLRVGSSQLGMRHEFRVCSASMRRASPVWKSMLFGPWKESKPSDPVTSWVVDLPDDKPSAVEILLAIIHAKFDIVHHSMSLSELHAILVVADKYDMISVIRPWASRWVQVARNPPRFSLFGTTKLSGEDHVLRIHAAWELGIDDLLSSEAQELLFNSSIVQGGTQLRVTYDGQHLSFDSHAGPGDLLEIVLGLRLSLIQGLLDFYHAEIACRTQDQKYACSKSEPSWMSSERVLCDSVVLGGIFRVQKRLKREPLPLKADNVVESANSIMGALSSMFSALPCLNDRHKECSPAKKYAEFQAKTKNDPRWKNIWQPHHKERMAAQRKKLGLPDPLK